MAGWRYGEWLSVNSITIGTIYSAEFGISPTSPELKAQQRNRISLKKEKLSQNPTPYTAARRNKTWIKRPEKAY